MKVLAVTNMMPSPENHKAGVFIADQIRSLREAGLDINVVLVDRANLGQQAYASTVARVRSAVRANGPDLVHIMYGGLMAVLAIPAARGLPRVVSFCGVDLLGARYGSTLYQLRTSCGRAASLLAARFCDRIIVKSQNLADGLPERLKRDRVSIIPNGVDLSLFRRMDGRECRRQLGWRQDGFHVLFSTQDRSNEKKRLLLADAALELLRTKGFETELHGLWRVPHERVPLWINACDLLLFTSREDEGSPNIVKETLACSRPVVSVDVGDVRERIRGIHGCHIAEPFAEDLAAKTAEVLQGSRRIDSEAAISEVSLEAVAQKVIAVYHQAFAARGRTTVNE